MAIEFQTILDPLVAEVPTLGIQMMTITKDPDVGDECARLRRNVRPEVEWLVCDLFTVPGRSALPMYCTYL